MHQGKKIPTPAYFFGMAGLLPFFAGAVLCWIAPSSVANYLSQPGYFFLLFYGAVILSFLGGVRWGVAMQYETLIGSWPVVAFAMVPSLLGWSALLVYSKFGILILVFGFLLQFVIDLRSTKRRITPEWYLTLRTILTIGAVVSLMIGWFGVASA